MKYIDVAKYAKNHDINLQTANKIIQNILFAKGYRWRAAGQNISYTDIAVWIVFENNQQIEYLKESEIEYYRNFEEIELKDIL